MVYEQIVPGILGGVAIAGHLTQNTVQEHVCTIDSEVLNSQVARFSSNQLIFYSLLTRLIQDFVTFYFKFS